MGDDHRTLRKDREDLEVTTGRGRAMRGVLIYLREFINIPLRGDGHHTVMTIGLGHPVMAIGLGHAPHQQLITAPKYKKGESDSYWGAQGKDQSRAC